MKKTAFIFGLGYVSVSLAHSLAKKGWQIRGTTRTPSEIANKVNLDWEILQFNARKPLIYPKTAFRDVNVIINTISWWK